MIKHIDTSENTSLFERINKEDRLYITVVPTSYEKYAFTSEESFIKMLNIVYGQKLKDIAPYHYYVGKEDVYVGKDEALKVTRDDELKGYTNDISVMILSNSIININKDKKNLLANLLVDLTERLAIPTNNILFPYEENGYDYDVSEIRKKVYLKRLEINPRHNILENISSAGDIVCSPYVSQWTTTETCYKPQDLARKFFVNKEDIMNMNPDVKEFAPGIKIYYPKTSRFKHHHLSKDYRRKVGQLDATIKKGSE